MTLNVFGPVNILYLLWPPVVAAHLGLCAATWPSEILENAFPASIFSVLGPFW